MGRFFRLTLPKVLCANAKPYHLPLRELFIGLFFLLFFSTHLRRLGTRQEATNVSATSLSSARKRGNNSVFATIESVRAFIIGEILKQFSIESPNQVLWLILPEAKYNEPIRT